MSETNNSGPRFTVKAENENAQLAFDSADRVTLLIQSAQPGHESNTAIVLKERNPECECEHVNAVLREHPELIEKARRVADSLRDS